MERMEGGMEKSMYEIYFFRIKTTLLSNKCTDYFLGIKITLFMMQIVLFKYLRENIKLLIYNLECIQLMINVISTFSRDPKYPEQYR